MNRGLPGGGTLVNNEERENCVQKLNEKHLIICRLRAMGWSVTSISEYMGMCISYFSQLLNSPLLKRRIAYYQELFFTGNADAVAEMRALAAEAVDTVGQILYDPDLSPKDRARVAFEIMDRGGVNKTQNLNVTTTHLTADDIRQLTENARAAGMEIVSDAEVEDDEEDED